MINLFSCFSLGCLLSISYASPVIPTSRGALGSGLEKRKYDAVCDGPRLGYGLSYDDCQRTLSQIPEDNDPSSYLGEQVFFPPAPGGYSSCAIAVFPFPITGEGADTDRWLWIKRYGAGRIISKCQMGKVFGEGGYYYGFGEDNNIAIVVFQMTRPEDVAPNTTPTLTEGAWEQLYGYVESATFGSSNIAYIDPDEPGTSSSHENLAAAAQPLTNIQATWTEEDLPVTDRGPQDMIDGLPRDFVTWMNDPSISTPEKGIGCGLSYCFDHADCGWGGFGGGRFGCGGCISFSPFQVGMDVLFGVGEAMFARLGRCGKPSTSNASPAQSPPTKPPGGGSSGSDL